MTMPSNRPPKRPWGVKPASDRLYDAIRALRAHGHQVSRVGLYHHEVDGVLVSGKRLVWIAAKAAKLQTEAGAA
jgi:hypothetical protein